MSKKYKKLSHHDHILERPDMYIGSPELVSLSMDTIQTKGGTVFIEKKEVSYIPGMLKIFDEIILNAADQSVLNPLCTKIDVSFSLHDKKVTVRNNGSGIPIEINEDEKIYNPEMIFGHLLTSENFETEGRIVGGKYGYGAKLTNIFSVSFTIETVCAGKKYTQTWTDNMKNKGEYKIEKTREADYTSISFVPDFSYFKQKDNLDLLIDFESLILRRCYDVSACTSEKVSVSYNKKKINVKNMVQYAKLWNLGTPVSTTKIGKIGSSNNEVTLYEVVAFLSDDYQSSFQHLSFVNSLWTISGGTHVTRVSNRITKDLSDMSEKGKKGKISETLIRNRLHLFLRVTVIDPDFNSQSKEELKTPYSKFGMEITIPESFIKKLYGSSVIKNLQEETKQKEIKKASKVSDGRKGKVGFIPGYEPANDAGTRNSEKCTLLITEGLSAKGMAMVGREITGTRFWGALPIRGKLLNLQAATVKQIEENVELSNIKKILGITSGKEYKKKSELNYGRVVVLADADDDGFHIAGLLFNLFYYTCPSLLELPDFLGYFRTPTVKATNPKTNEVREFFSISEFRKSKKNEGWHVKYYKGLGTSDKKESLSYFRRLSELIVSMKKTETCFDSLKLAFSKKRTNDRKDWIMKYDNIPRPIPDGTMSYDFFVNKILIQFSVSDNLRSIPCIIDGLKPSQRKILYTMIQENIEKPRKLTEIAGLVTAMTDYNHGQESLYEAEINMAQSFWCSNNIPLFLDKGNFGSRNENGKDHAAARYISSCLQSITKKVYHPDDYPILHYLKGETKSIEPKYYVPIIPMVLVNGSEGIGTGFSTSIPKFNPLDIIRKIRWKLKATTSDIDLVPWYMGHQRRVEVIGKKFVSRGIYEKKDDNTLVITELPAETSSSAYKEFLYSIVADEKKDDKEKKKKSVTYLDSFESALTSDKVEFTLTFHENTLNNLIVGGLDSFETKLRLRKNINTSNMVSFDYNGYIMVYQNVDKIIDTFYNIRSMFYEMRKEYLEKKLQEEICIMNNRVRFVRDILEGFDDHFRGIVIFRKTSKEIHELLEKHKYDPHPKNGGYDYLLSMRVHSFSKEKIEELEKQHEKLQNEYKIVKERTPAQFWLNDLKTLESDLLSMKLYE